MIDFKEEQDVWEKHYLRERSRLSQPDENVVRYISRLIREGVLKKGMTSLDIGAGTGRHREFIQSLGINSFGLDFSFEAISGSPNSIQACGDQLPFVDGVVDFILVWGVIHYLNIHQSNNLIKEVVRVLKYNGKALFTVRAAEDSHLKKQQCLGDLKGGKSKLYQKDELEKLFKPFKINRTGWIGRIPLGESDLVAHHIVEVVL